MNTPTVKPFQNRIGLLALTVLFAAILACSVNTGDEAVSPDKPASEAQSDSDTAETGMKRPSGIKKAFGDASTEEPQKEGTSEIDDVGDFLPIYSNIKNEYYAGFDQLMRKQKILESITNDLNASLALPTDVKVTFRDCGQPNAFYDPRNKTVTMCYEFMHLFYNKFLQMGYDEEEANQMMFGATTFFFLHELGHCLIDVYDLPAVGREEDSVDQLSTFILMDEMSEEGIASALAGVLIFKALSENERTSKQDFADEHSLSSQRYFNLACWMYGRDTNRMSNFVSQGVIPEARARRCPSEYKKMSRAWERLVQPYVKK